MKISILLEIVAPLDLESKNVDFIYRNCNTTFIASPHLINSWFSEIHLRFRGMKREDNLLNCYSFWPYFP